VEDVGKLFYGEAKEGCWRVRESGVIRLQIKFAIIWISKISSYIGVV
jgi:hypothetical protein